MNPIAFRAPGTILVQTPFASTVRPTYGVEIDSVRFSAKPAATSLLANTPAHEGFLQDMLAMLEPFDVDMVQHWDETKTPPLPVLKTFTDKGVFVNGVPLPRMEGAQTLLADPTVQAMMSTEKLKELQDLLANTDKRNASHAYLDPIGKDGFAKAMILASLNLPKSTSVGVSTFLGVNNGLSAQSVFRIGTPEQQALWLNALNHGVFTYGFGLTEDKIGSDPRSIKTTFTKEIGKDGKTCYRLNGNKKFIGNAARVLDKDGSVIHRGADFLVIYAVDNPNAPPASRSFRAFMVPRTAIGEENIRHTGGEHNKMGLREVNNGDFDLKDVVVPESLLLGKPDEDIYKKLLGLLDITRLFVGSMGIGTTEGTLKAAKAFASQRSQNGQIINQFPMVQFPLKRLEARAAAGKLLLMEAARLVDEGDRKIAKGEKPERYGLETAMAKLYCTELAEDTTQQGSNTLGGRGFLEDPKQGLGIPKRRRDAKVLTIYEGTSNINRNVIAAGVLSNEMNQIDIFEHPENMRRALRFLLFKSYVSRFTHYWALKLTSFSPIDQVNLEYQKATVDVMMALKAELKKLKHQWKVNGTPPEYDGWDEKSKKRQLNMNASVAVQERLGILADIAVQRKLLHLALKELNILGKKPALNSEELALQKNLRLFEQLALETVLQKARELKNTSLKMLEEDCRQA